MKRKKCYSCVYWTDFGEGDWGTCDHDRIRQSIKNHDIHKPIIVKRYFGCTYHFTGFDYLLEREKEREQNA